VIDTGLLSTTAALIAGFGVAAFVFRMQRELDMQKQKEWTWIPWADMLLIAATSCAILLVLLPMVMGYRTEFFGRRLPLAGCAAALVAVLGYIPAVLAHYRYLGGDPNWNHPSRPEPHGPRRRNPEPAEKWIVRTTAVLAIIAFGASFAITA
jgi:hypothetical protein